MSADDERDDEGGDDPALASLLARLAATPRRQAPLLAPGARLGAFVVEELLGRGGMGEVWRARDTRLQRAVALKVLRTSAREAQLLEEARAAAAVQHPRVATVYELGEADGPGGKLGFIALELVPGETLRKRLRAGALPVAQVLSIAADAAQGLAAVHERGLVHRDIKPDNLAVDASGRVKLLDFGIATLAGADASSWGTPRYLPPEQRAEGKADASADVFALGVTLLELLTGKAPFDDAGALAPELAGDPLARARALPRLPRPFLDLLGRCVAVDMAARPPDARALVEVLEPLVHPRPSARERATPFLLVGLAAVLTVASFSAVTRVEDAVAADLPPALASAPVVSQDARVRARFRAAADALLAGDDSTAAAALAEVVPSEPDSAWSWALLILTEATPRAGKTQAQAIAEVERRADPSTREGRALRALVALADARALGEAQSIPPSAPAVALGRAALEEAGADAFTAVLLAAMLPFDANVQEKLDRIDAALSRDVRVALLWSARADALRIAGRAPEAIEAARAGLARVPGNGALEDALLRARLAHGEAEEVERELRERLRARPDDLGARLLGLEVVRARGDVDAARREALLLLDGPFPRAAVGRAVAELALGLLAKSPTPTDRAMLVRALATLDEAGLASLAARGRAVLDAVSPETNPSGG